MAGILFVYTRTSIQAAKRNAQQHRDADGGQINWHNESLRRHGRLERPVEQESVRQLAGIARERRGKTVEGMGEGRVREMGRVSETQEERRVRERIEKGGRET